MTSHELGDLCIMKGCTLVQYKATTTGSWFAVMGTNFILFFFLLLVTFMNWGIFALWRGALWCNTRLQQLNVGLQWWGRLLFLFFFSLTSNTLRPVTWIGGSLHFEGVHFGAIQSHNKWMLVCSDRDDFYFFLFFLLTHCSLFYFDHSSEAFTKCMNRDMKKQQQSDCAPSEDSDQPGHPPNLIRVFGVP